MKEIGLNALFIVYSFSALAVMGLTMLSPFMYDFKDIPFWFYCVLYPLCLLAMSSQNIVFKFFSKHKLF